MTEKARYSGIIMPISSLPGKYGIGTFGKAAYEYADFLKAAGQKYWQVLPLGPTSYGDSPYQSFSTFAGNPYFVDPDMLIEEGLLLQSEVDSCDWGSDPRHVDYGKLYENRLIILGIAKERGWDRLKPEIDKFTESNKRWLLSYAEFMALKTANGMKAWTEWECTSLSDSEIITFDVGLQLSFGKIKELFIFIQFEFFRQWMKLKKYINGLGILVIGDLPIYVAMDSADVWSEPEMFKLDSDNRPVVVAGVPPDYFDPNGQLWGNPIYNYDKMKATGYEWWIRRVGGAALLFDMIRFDHFRGFASYWEVPYGEKTAINGRWVKGPGMDLIGTLTSWFHGISFIAEDLGDLTEDVYQLIEDSGLPGMKVLEFAFSPDGESDYLPHKYQPHCICYAGSHDNAPLQLWKQQEAPEVIAYAQKYLGLNEEEGFNRGIIRGGMSSAAELFVTQMQDYLGLGEGCRMNCPGNPYGNWQWRMLPGEAGEELAAEIYSITKMYGRQPE